MIRVLAFLLLVLSAWPAPGQELYFPGPQTGVRTSDVTNVKLFGAIGDGVADDTAAFQTAINVGGLIYVPAGQYKITSTLTIGRAAFLEALAADSTSVSTTLSNSPNVSLLQNFIGDLIQIKGVNGNSLLGAGSGLRNIALVSNVGDGTTHTGGAAIRILGTSDTYYPSWVRLENVNIEGQSGKHDWQYGVYIDGSATTLNGGRDTQMINVRIVTGTNSVAGIHMNRCTQFFFLNVLINGPSTAIANITAPSVGNKSSGYWFGSGGDTLNLDYAANIRFTGGAWTTVTTTANTATSQVLASFITNTPARPASGNTIAGYINAIGRYVVMTGSGDFAEYRASGLGFTNGAAASIGTLDSQNFQLLANGNTVMTITPQSQAILIANTFSTLGTPGNGAIAYCSDCTIANPCAGSGTGALAKRLNGVWVCN